MAALTATTVASPTAADRRTVSELATLVAHVDGEPSLDGLDPTTATGGLVVATVGDDLAGAAVIEPGGAAWSVEVVTAPEHRDAGVDERLAVEAMGHARRQGATTVHLWLSPSTPRLAEATGPRRTLVEMRVALPLDSDASVPVRPYRPGDDDEAVLAVNNRAFAWHPEQSGWTAQHLEHRRAEPWFDPQGFLLHEADGQVAGFCWTKVHRDHDPVLGEIHVIAVDPAFQGRGLGRALTVEGFRWLAGQGVGTGMLWVEGDNTPALALYGQLGLTEHRRREARVIH